ncbi:hypothetical protein F4679DRAFT_129540 [Xylaria curta]|nr:hypothetical protein F4679DRAFT_129540 [Xylaria curta]
MKEKTMIKDDCTDEKIIELCKEHKESCNELRWINVEDKSIKIDESVVALAVDMKLSRGHVRVFDEEHNQLDMVGKYEQGYTVILWVEKGWRCMCFGPCRIALLSVTRARDLGFGKGSSLLQ